MNSVILIVDDNAASRQTLESILSGQGYQLHMAEDGVQALKQAEDLHPDLILLDVMMPGMDGPATYKLLKEDPAVTNTPVIFMTAKVQGQELESYSQLGVQGVISKPFNPLTLPAEIEALVNGG